MESTEVYYLSDYTKISWWSENSKAVEEVLLEIYRSLTWVLTWHFDIVGFNLLNHTELYLCGIVQVWSRLLVQWLL